MRLEKTIFEELAHLAAQRAIDAIDSVIQLIDDPKDRAQMTAGVMCAILGYVGRQTADSFKEDTGQDVPEYVAVISALKFLVEVVKEYYAEKQPAETGHGDAAGPPG